MIDYPKGHVSFEHVDFGYKADQLLIKDMNIDVKPGQTLPLLVQLVQGKQH